LSWEPAIDIDIDRYEIRRLPDEDFDISAMNDTALNQLWSAAAVMNQTVGLRLMLEHQPPGTFIYMAKAMDSVGQYSVRPACANVSVTLDTAAQFVDSWKLGVIERLNVSQWSAFPHHVSKHTTDHGDTIGYGHVDPDDSTGVFLDLAMWPFVVPHSAGQSEVLTHVIDLGHAVSGTWKASADIEGYGGNLITTLELSGNGTDWEQHTGTWNEATALRMARFARVRISSDGAFTLTGNVNLQLVAIPRTARGEIMVGANGTFTVIVPGQWASYLKGGVTVQYVGQELFFAVRDDVIINNHGAAQFNVFLFNSASERVTGLVEWEFRGV
jgi:hypothetical protein